MNLPFVPAGEPVEITGFKEESTYIGFARQVSDRASGPWDVYRASSMAAPAERGVRVPSKRKAIKKLLAWGADEIEDPIAEAKVIQDSCQDSVIA